MYASGKYCVATCEVCLPLVRDVRFFTNAFHMQKELLRALGLPREIVPRPDATSRLTEDEVSPRYFRKNYLRAAILAHSFGIGRTWSMQRPATRGSE